MLDGQIGVIDYRAYDKEYGDPWREFDQTNWGGEADEYLWTGLINGYFKNPQSADGFTLPNNFFLLLTYYLSYNALVPLCDGDASGHQGYIQEGKWRLNNILRWFDNMNSSVPTWYQEDFHVQHMGGISQ